MLKETLVKGVNETKKLIGKYRIPSAIALIVIPMLIILWLWITYSNAASDFIIECASEFEKE